MMRRVSAGLVLWLLLAAALAACGGAAADPVDEVVEPTAVPATDPPPTDPPPTATEPPPTDPPPTDPPPTDPPPTEAAEVESEATEAPPTEPPPTDTPEPTAVPVTMLSATAIEFAFAPETVWEAPAGSEVELALANDGALQHVWAVVEAGADIGDAYSEDEADSLFYASPILNGGESGAFTFTAPDAPGSYLVICTIPGHFQAGMKGEFVVGE